MRIYFVFSPQAVETNPTVHHANGTLQMLAQFFLSLSAVKQARQSYPLLYMFNIYGEKRPQPMFFFFPFSF